MEYTFQIYSVDSAGDVKPHLFPLTLNLFSDEEARSIVLKIVAVQSWPVGSVILKSQDGRFSERWVRCGDDWRQEDA